MSLELQYTVLLKVVLSYISTYINLIDFSGTMAYFLLLNLYKLLF